MSYSSEQILADVEAVQSGGKEAGGVLRYFDAQNRLLALARSVASAPTTTAHRQWSFDCITAQTIEWVSFRSIDGSYGWDGKTIALVRLDDTNNGGGA